MDKNKYNEEINGLNNFEDGDDLKTCLIVDTIKLLKTLMKTIYKKHYAVDEMKTAYFQLKTYMGCSPIESIEICRKYLLPYKENIMNKTLDSVIDKLNVEEDGSIENKLFITIMRILKKDWKTTLKDKEKEFFINIIKDFLIGCALLEKLERKMKTLL